MPLQDSHPRDLQLASDSHFAVRAIPVHSSHWKPEPENRPTSGAFDDLEVSVDLLPEDQSAEQQLKTRYQHKIQEKGVGYAVALVSNIRATLAEKEINGNVWKDPVTDNELHGIITGPKNKKKKETLRNVFSVQIRPKTPPEVFGN